MRKKIPLLAGEYIAEEMRTHKYPREQAIAIGISRARAAEKSTKRRKTTMATQADQEAGTELKIFIDNDGDLYRGQTTSIFKNLMTKVGRGTYDSTKAVQLFMYLVEAGAKKYAKEYGGTWNLMFTVPTRKLVATAMRDEFETEAKLGNYDHYLPKKYSKTVVDNHDLYKEGEAHALHVARNSPKSAIEYMAAVGEVFPQGGRRHIPEIAHLPTPKNSKKPAFKQGFANKMTELAKS